MDTFNGNGITESLALTKTRFVISGLKLIRKSVGAEDSIHLEVLIGLPIDVFQSMLFGADQFLERDKRLVRMALVNLQRTLPICSKQTHYWNYVDDTDLLSLFNWYEEMMICKKCALQKRARSEAELAGLYRG